MSLFRTSFALALSALSLAPLAAGAQEAAAQPGFDTGAPAGGVGAPYVKETSGDWDVRCVKTAAGFDPCQLYQLLKDATGNPVAEISLVALAPGGQAAAGATIVTPLETLLTRQVTFTIDQNTPKVYPYSWCSQQGCFARVGFLQTEIDAMKKGTTASLQITPLSAPDQVVTLTVSLKGFTAGYDHMAQINDETKAARDKAAASGAGAAAPSPSGN